MMRGQAGRERKRGHSVIEVALIAPWIFFLFVGVFDFGFYAHALISTQNAARAAALVISSTAAAAGSQSLACEYVRGELKKMPNTPSLPPGCDALPLRVQVTPFTDSEGQAATRVAVTYQTLPLIPIPGLLTGRTTITRTVEMRVR